MSDDTAVPDQEFRLAPEYQRAMHIAAWGLAACSWFGLIMVAWFDAVPLLSTRIILPLVFTLAAFVASWWVRHWRVRVDAVGIHTRRFIQWRAWSWEVFSSGTVVAGKVRGSFVFPDLPWRLRRLSLEYLESTDKDYLIELCAQVWEVPPPPELPQELHLQLGPIVTRYLRRRTFRANGYGLELDRGGRTKAYRWSDVQKLILFRTSHEHIGFTEMRIHLPDTVEVIVYDSQREMKLWAGPDPEVISAYLLQHIPSGKVVNCATSGPARSLNEVEVRTEYMNKALKKYRTTVRVIRIAATIALIAFFLFNRPQQASDTFSWIGAALIAAVGVGLFVVAVPTKVIFQEGLAELAQERERLSLVDESTATDTPTL